MSLFDTKTSKPYEVQPFSVEIGGTVQKSEKIFHIF